MTRRDSDVYGVLHDSVCVYEEGVGGGRSFAEKEPAAGGPWEAIPRIVLRDRPAATGPFSFDLPSALNPT